MSSVLHITANSRLTGFLKQQLLAKQWQHTSVAATPNVMTLTQWWQTWEQALLFSGELTLDALPKKQLSAFEAQWLWEKLLTDYIQEDEDSDAAIQTEIRLLNLSATAKQLYEAWQLFNKYLSNELLS